MIRVKVLSIKEGFKKIIVLISIIVCIFLFVKIYSRFTIFNSRSFSYNLVEENLKLNNNEKNMHAKIIMSELGLENNWLKSERNLYYKETIEEIYDISEDEYKNVYDENDNIDFSKYLAGGLVRNWNRP